MSKLRILVATGIFPPSVGGPATYSKLLLDELPERGIEVKIASFDAVRRYPKIIRHILYIFLLFKKSKGISHIYAQDPVSVGLPGLFVAKVLRKKFFIRVAGDYAWEQSAQRFGVKDDIDSFQDKKYSWRVELLRNIQRGVVSGADKVITPSDYFKDLVGKWSDEKNRVIRIYNGIELPNISLDKESARKKLDIDKSEQVIISAGRLVPWKGFSSLINIVGDIAKNNSKVRLFVLGDGPEKNNLLNEEIGRAHV